MYSLFVVLLIALGSAVFGAGAGWTVNEWRNGAKMERLESRDAVVTAANDKCAADVVAVQSGVKDVSDALDAKQKAAEAAMKDAQYWASKHSTLAEEVNSLPIRDGESVCDAVTREQGEYVTARRGSGV